MSMIIVRLCIVTAIACLLSLKSDRIFLKSFINKSWW